MSFGLSHGGHYPSHPRPTWVAQRRDSGPHSWCSFLGTRVGNKDLSSKYRDYVFWSMITAFDRRGTNTGAGHCFNPCWPKWLTQHLKRHPFLSGAKHLRKSLSGHGLTAEIKIETSVITHKEYIFYKNSLEQSLTRLQISISKI